MADCGANKRVKLDLPTSPHVESEVVNLPPGDGTAALVSPVTNGVENNLPDSLDPSKISKASIDDTIIPFDVIETFLIAEWACDFLGVSKYTRALGYKYLMRDRRVIEQLNVAHSPRAIKPTPSTPAPPVVFPSDDVIMFTSPLCRAIRSSALVAAKLMHDSEGLLWSNKLVDDSVLLYSAIDNGSLAALHFVLVPEPNSNPKRQNASGRVLGYAIVYGMGRALECGKIECFMRLATDYPRAIGEVPAITLGHITAIQNDRITKIVAPHMNDSKTTSLLMWSLCAGYKFGVETFGAKVTPRNLQRLIIKVMKESMERHAIDSVNAAGKFFEPQFQLADAVTLAGFSIIADCMGNKIRAERIPWIAENILGRRYPALANEVKRVSGASVLARRTFINDITHEIKELHKALFPGDANLTHCFVYQ